MFRGFQRFFRGFQRSSQRPSQRQISLSEALSFVAPIRVFCPLNFLQVTAWVGRGGSPDQVARGLPTSGQASKVYLLCAEPKEHKHFRPGARPGGSGTRPGGSVTGLTEKLFMCICQPL